MGLTEILLIVVITGLIINIVLTLTKKNAIDEEQLSKQITEQVSAKNKTEIDALEARQRAEQSQSRSEINQNTLNALSTLSETLLNAQKNSVEQQNAYIKSFTTTLSSGQEQLRNDLSSNIDAFKLDTEKNIAALKAATQKSIDELNTALKESFAALEKTVSKTTEMLSAAQKEQFAMQDKRLGEMTQTSGEKQDALQKMVEEKLRKVDERFSEFTKTSTTSLEATRQSVNERLEAVRADNEKSLEKMRQTVDEKLQKTLDERITQSFALVSEQLKEVYAGLGEMKNLASGVGDLKKVLSNVKTRGIMGEIQLGAIISELLSPEQYAENIATVPNSANRVEYAIRLPGDGDKSVYLPIDAKFPLDTYSTLVDAYETGEPEQIRLARAALETRIKGCAKDIHEKYIDPPYTTDFAIMFLPVEGLYAEVVRFGLIEVLQRDYKVNIAGPTTFAALLNSLQMGFRTLAIQKRSSEVWNVLGAVKTEFGKFSDVLASVQKKLDQTGNELQKLVGARTKKINLRLSEISALPQSEAAEVLAISENETSSEQEDTEL